MDDRSQLRVDIECELPASPAALETAFCSKVTFAKPFAAMPCMRNCAVLDEGSNAHTFR